MGTKCPQCHSDNPDNSRFCADCGTQLLPPEEISAPTKTIEVPKEELTTGSTFAGRYQIIEELGKGGMGNVYKVLDKEINVKVALKLIKPEIAADKKIIERFRNELKVARDIAHRNVCRMYDLGKEESSYFITMEYVSGEDMKSMIRMSGQLSTGTAIKVVKQVCEGLSEAHRLGIIHRDLKPSNIIIDKEGDARIMDFGIARSLKTGGLTGTGVMVGTPEYMSPEQVEGKDIDQRSDIYSLGIILYEMMTGRVPFEGDTPFSIAFKHKTEVPPNPRKINPQIPVNLERLILKCMEKDKKKRYQTVEELTSDLTQIEEKILTAEKILPKIKPPTSKELTVTFNLRKFFIPGSMFVGLVLIAIIVWWFARGKVISMKNEIKPISILIADFDNQTGDPVFDGSLEHALSLGLKGAPFISSYNRNSARKAANQLDPNSEGQLDSQMAQTICRQEGIDLVVAGSIEPSGEGYTINVWTLHPTKAEKITEISREITIKAEVLKATDKLATQLASQLGGVKLRYKRHMTTTSLAAMNAFSKAVKLEDEGKNEQAIKQYLRAIQEDREFGHAYSNLGNVYYNLGQEQKAREYYEMAMSHMGRMTENEKNSIRATYYLIVRNYKKVIEALSTVLRLNPKSHWARGNIALAYFFARDMKRAVEEGKHAVELNPKSITYRYNLVWYAMGAADFELAEEEARTILNLNSKFEEGYVCLALLNLIQGRVEQARETYQRLKSLSSYGASYATIGLADLALYEGCLVDARQMLEKAIAADFKDGLNDFAAEKLIMLAQTYLLQGKKILAINTADRALALSKKESVLFSATLIFLSAGQEDKAADLTEELAEKIYPEYQAYAKLLKGEIKKWKGDVPGAIRLSDEAQSLIDTWLGHFILGCAYFEAGAFAEAHEEFELCLKRRGEAASIFFDDIPSCRYLSQVYYYLGRTLEELKSPDASEFYQKFLKIKEKADPGIPEVEDAKKKLAGLRNQ